MARRVWFERPDALEDQPLKPWLDQIVLPIALAQLGIPRSEVPDPIHKAIIHYHFPFYLQVRYARAERLFADLSKDNTLSSVFQHAPGFHTSMSEEGQNIVREVYETIWSNPENRNYKAFEKELRRRVLVMR